MDPAYLKQILAAQPGIVRALLADVSPVQARWKPDPDRWSILEVINHLYDEEREDFRLHLDTILHHPEGEWHPIRPMAWVEERRYNERELNASLEKFLEERRASLVWLENLESPDWDAEVEAPWGAMRAGDMFASWVVHGEWHIEQVVRLRRDYATEQSLPYSVRYAGTL